MQRSGFLLVLSMHLAASVFFHEKSSIELVPEDLQKNSSFGFSLGFQEGEHPNLVIGAPRYDLTGRVYQCSIADILDELTACKHIDIDFDKLHVSYNRSMSPNQYFYLGASIAATEKFFLTCAPLRAAFGDTHKDDGKKPTYGAFGICFNYDSAKGARQYHGFGLEKYIEIKKEVSNEIYGGSGWSILVDQFHDTIAISKSFINGDITVGSASDPEKPYQSLRHIMKLRRDKSFTNLGQAMTFGNYFHEDKNHVYYAVGMKNYNALGAIAFFDYRWRKTERNLNEERTVGSMFGAALTSADVTGDGCAELIVGAPAHVADRRSYDKGAVHVYTKSETPSELKMLLKLSILGVKDGARFGTTLSSNDVDGDSYPEIIVSAPWEKSGVGAMYVLCGYEIHKTLKRTTSIFVSDLMRAQRIEAEKHMTFGYSVQPVTDFNDNGSDELGIGSPGSSNVKLYKGIRSVTANVTSRFLGNPSESDSEYVFSSCVAVDLPPKPATITTKLLVKNILNGNDAKFKNRNEATYMVNLAAPGVHTADGKTEYCKNLIIESSSFCKLTTNVSLADDFQKHKDFQNTWVTLSAQSVLEKTVQLMCLCNETSCAPELNVIMEWSRKNESSYLVGSSSLENVTISVHNKGTMGCNVCVMVRVSGALVEQLQCELDHGEYKCAMLNPFRANSTKKIELVLLMDKLTNEDKRLTIDVAVRKNCEYPAAAKVKSFTVEYEFNTDAIIVNGSCTNRNISDTELMDLNEDILISDEQIYTIQNTQSVTWKNVWANITAPKKGYIESFKVSTKQGYCSEKNSTDTFYWSCPLTLAQYSTIELIVSTTMLKKDIPNYLQDWRITITSELLLQLSEHDIKNKTLTTVMMFEKELTIGQNKTLIVTIAVVVALLLLLIFVLILYKLNFFRRKNKEELKALKSEFRRRSTKRRDTPSSAQANPNPIPERVSRCDTDDLMIVEESLYDTTHREPNADTNAMHSK